MPRANHAREQAMWGRVREAHDLWEHLEPFEQQMWLTRISEGMGIWPEQARARIEGAPCPFCGSMNLDREPGALDFCNECRGLSRDGKDIK